MAPSPNHIMLAIHCKRTDQVELKAPILAYIRDTYSDREAEDAEDDLALVQSLRNDIVASQSGPQAAIKEQLTKCVVFFGWSHTHICCSFPAPSAACALSRANLRCIRLMQAR